MDIAVNINETIRFRLTECGKAFLAARLKEEGQCSPLSADYLSSVFRANSEGESRCQLWQLMRTFGASCCGIFDPPFTGIVIESGTAERLAEVIRNLLAYIGSPVHGGRSIAEQDADRETMPEIQHAREAIGVGGY